MKGSGSRLEFLLALICPPVIKYRRATAVPPYKLKESKVMPQTALEMRFDPQTIKHLGLRMYSTLPPALSELISNSYDADAENVQIILKEEHERPVEIEVVDDGCGLSFDEINEKFLVIGRNRREKGDEPSPRFRRLPTGKKGLGKLALFGLAKVITITTVKDSQLNQFELNWDVLMDSRDNYNPKVIKHDEPTEERNGTKISLKDLKRKTSFNVHELANSLAKIFILDDTFKLTIESNSGDKTAVNNSLRYSAITEEFSWTLERNDFLLPEGSPYRGKLKGVILTSEKPLPPSSNLRGITIFSRGKLVNAPEFFSESTSSHFYQYLTGYIVADFVDQLQDDVISTNRQSIDWEHPEMIELRAFLSGVVSQLNSEWRRLRKDKKEKELEYITGINTSEWTRTMPDKVRQNVTVILSKLGGEDSFESYTPAIKALHEILPEYPLLHWRHLHPEIRSVSDVYYKNRDYYHAVLEGIKRYVNEVKTKSNILDKGEHELMGYVFKPDENNEHKAILDVVDSYKKKDGSCFIGNTKKNIQKGQQQLSVGLIDGTRHPLSHEEINDLRESNLFSEKDCLDVLSLLSHLYFRLDNSFRTVS